MKSLILAPLLGLIASFALEAALQPRPHPPWRRPLGSGALHCGLWLVAFAALCLVIGRPWCAAAGVSAFLLLLVLVNNAKLASLHEPFVFQDFEYFTDAIRHPRLYIPFLGWPKALTAAAAFALAVYAGYWLEPASIERLSLNPQLGGLAELATFGAILLYGGRKGPAVRFDATDDLVKFGLIASLWAYGRAEQTVPPMPSRFPAVARADGANERPHLVTVQSESFFDPRGLFHGIRPDVLAEFDRLKAAAIHHGKLSVPAWGANTVRSEFAFLTGLDEATLGVHRFNPYRRAARAGVVSLAHVLKNMGYRTVCIHPYPASFYARDKVYPLLGFDEFIDVRAFADAPRTGPYVGDLAVARKIAEIVEHALEPVFVFAITMENHGPLHLETPHPEDETALYSAPPPSGCEDLTIYLRHLRNADRMVAQLRATLAGIRRKAYLCWYGDHVPIMPQVYARLGRPRGETEYALWSNGPHMSAANTAHKADSLAQTVLRVMRSADAIHD